MAVINGKSNYRQHNVMESKWSAVPQNSTGTPEQLSRWPDHSVTFAGTFGGATVVLQGSDDGVNWFTIVGENPAGGADIMISTGIAQRFDFKAVPLHIRPSVGAGAVNTAIDVIITSKGYGH